MGLKPDGIGKGAVTNSYTPTNSRVTIMPNPVAMPIGTPIAPLARVSLTILPGNSRKPQVMPAKPLPNFCAAVLACALEMDRKAKIVIMVKNLNRDCFMR